MKALCNRKRLLDAFGMVAGVVPARSPKPILQNVKLVAEPDEGSILMATDLEVGIRSRVLGVKVDQPGAAILPTQRMTQILRTSSDEELMIEVDQDQLVVRGLRSEFKLPSEDPDLFPEVPDFALPAFHVLAAGDLRRGILRTMFATDPESTRYALGGVLVEPADGQMTLVGTDGRRLARMIIPTEAEGAPGPYSPAPVIPVKALKLIEKNLADEDDKGPVHLGVQSGSAVLIRIPGKSVIYSRLVEGRFPRYQDVFPGSVDVKIPMECGTLRLAVEQASIVTSDESRGVDFSFGQGRLKLNSKAADVGSSFVEMPIPYDGKDVEITFDPRYLIDALKTLDDDAVVTAELIDHKSAAVFKTDDQYTYVVMPLTRDR
ncbi:MAG: DNA polymerase III subunit beta [Isosphaeraceae bacterium]